MTLVSLEGVSFAHGTRPVLEDVTLSVAPGELVCLAGPNGAGKTTLLKIVAALLAPDAGTVTVADQDPRRTPRRALARRLAYLAQDYALAFPFTVGEVVLMGRYPHGSGIGLERDADLRAAEAAMERCDVAALAGRRWDELSGGERRRALLAQAFCQAAEVVLLDEPTASLDPAHAIAIWQALAEERRARGAAALVATHDLNLAARFADRLAVLDGGRLAAVGPPSEVLGSAAAARAFAVRLHVGELPDGGAPFVVPW